MSFTEALLYLLVEILEELLDERNALSIRKEGIRLFLIWFQVLGTNATEKCHHLFVNLVPGFGGIILEFQRKESRVPPSPAQHVSEASRAGMIFFSLISVGYGKQSSIVQPREPVVLVPPTSESNEGVGLTTFSNTPCFTRIYFLIFYFLEF